MANDLISRKALVAALIKEREQYPPMVAERYSFGVKVPHQFNQAMRGGIRKALRLVEIAPAVDAVPVRRGKWLPLRVVGYNGLYPIWAHPCSECGFEEKHFTPRRICPNCDAVMEEMHEP